MLYVTVTTELTERFTFSEWNFACGEAVRLALGNAKDVLLEDKNGALYRVYAVPVEDNS